MPRTWEGRRKNQGVATELAATVLRGMPVAATSSPVARRRRAAIPWLYYFSQLAAAEAARADLDRGLRLADHCLDLQEIRLPRPAGPVLRVAHLVPCDSALSAYFTLARHLFPALDFSCYQKRQHTEKAQGCKVPWKANQRIMTWPPVTGRACPVSYRWLIRRMDAIIATSELSASFLKRKATVIPHGVDTDRYCPPTDRAAAFAQT